MASSVIRCTCPHCGGGVGIKDQTLIGKRIRCPKCQQPFVVEAPTGEEEPAEPPLKTSVKATRKAVPPPSRVDEDERVQAGPPPKKKPRVEEDEGDADNRPRKKKKKKKQQGV